MGKHDAARMAPLRSRGSVAATLPGGALRTRAADRATDKFTAQAKRGAASGRERLLSPVSKGALAASAVICLALMFPREPLRERLLADGLRDDRTLDRPTLAYLDAWLRVSPPDAGLIAELAERYARAGRLAEAEALLARTDASGQQEAALPILRARLDIARQRANAAPNDRGVRERYLSELRTLLQQAARLPAPPSDMIAFAAQARAIGADDLEMAFYRALACPAPSHAAFAQRPPPAAPVQSEWREPRRPPPPLSPVRS